jgi:monoamine oxidase
MAGDLYDLAADADAGPDAGCPPGPDRWKGCRPRSSGLTVAVVGGGFAGLMAARTLSRWGASVTVYEARAKVGGRVLSDTTFAKGRITELGAELIGAIHTRWRALAKEHGISLITRMDGDVYSALQLPERVILDSVLTPDEVIAVEKDVRAVLLKIADFAKKVIPAGAENRPWTVPALATYDETSVATALEQQFGVRRDARLWKALQLLLEHDNVAPLEQANFLALLCLVRGGQTALPPDEKEEVTLMRYWDQLETYRCGDGCQRLAQVIADEVHRRRGCRVITSLGVHSIALPPGGGVLVTARSTKDRRIDEWLRDTYMGVPLIETRPYDYVVLAVPPTVWRDIKILPRHPLEAIGNPGSGKAAKCFSRMTSRFWLRSGFAPVGGSLDIGQVWEGTDNQTLGPEQDIVLSVYTGSKIPTLKEYKDGLARLYPVDHRIPGSGYGPNLKKEPLLVDWSSQPFIRTGFATPRLREVFTIGKAMNEPFQGRLIFAGEHTQPDHFGYMEGAIRSGERAACMVLDLHCPPGAGPQQGPAPRARSVRRGA